MDIALSYLQNIVQSKADSWKLQLELDEEDYLIRKAQKVNTVLDIMGFCQNECNLSFKNQLIDSKSPQKDFTSMSENKEACFMSCTSKTFEAKQIESFLRDQYFSNSDFE